LGAYATEQLEYAFYFPRAGRWSHFPAHVTRAGALVAFAEPRELEVVATPTAIDQTSWSHVSQEGSLDEVLAFLRRANLGRIDLARIAWRMHDALAFNQVTALLESRRSYHDRLWAYSLMHKDARRAAEWLRHQEDFLRPASPLSGGLVEIDPVERGWFQHLEYAPLINARAHQLGARRRILNAALETQYRAFLELVAQRARPSAEDCLALAHYQLAMDRPGEALATLARVRGVDEKLQLDYLAAYAALSRGDLSTAREVATRWADHPVDRWQKRFR